MAIEDILKKIRSDSDRETNELKEQALVSAGRIEEQGKEKAIFLKGKILEGKVADAAREKERIIVEAQLQLKGEILFLKRQALKEAFVKALDKIKKSPQLYQEFFEKILSQFAHGSEEIILSAEDRKFFSEDWLKQFNKRHKLNLRYSEFPAEISAGLIIHSGKKEINATFKVLLKEVKEKNEAEAAKILFGEV